MSRRIVTAEELDALAADYAPPAPVAPAPPSPAPDPPPRPSPSSLRPTPAKRCAAYLVKVGPAISGEHGHDRTYMAARLIWNDFGVDEAEGFPILQSFNLTCQPAWTEKELRHKWADAVKAGPGPEGRGYRLRQDRAGYGAPRGDAPGRVGGNYSKYDSAPSANGSHPAPPADPGDRLAGERAKQKYRFIDHAEFREMDFRVEWFVEWFLSKNRPAVVAGPSKGMKTSILVDLAVSIATATPHLGKWRVPERARVAIVSGESGGFTLKETAARVCRAKGLDFSAPDGWLKWEFTLPTFADLIDTAAFADRLGELECEVVVIDPFYLTLGEIDAKNLFEMGQALRAVAELLLTRHGVTPVIAHHANRGLERHQPMELTHLAYSGLEQFAGQWVFINRKEDYRGDGRHELWYGHGGRDGHQGLSVVTIEEGVLGLETPTRRWDVLVRTPEEVRGEQAEEKRKEAREDERKRHDADENEVMAVVDAQAKKGLPGASVSLIADRSVTLTEYRTKAAIDRLKDRGLLVKVAPFDQPSGHGAMVRVTNGFGRPESDREEGRAEGT